MLVELAEQTTREGAEVMLLDDIKEHLIEGDSNKVSDLIHQALDEGFKVEDILNNALIAGMKAIGELFQRGEIYLPEMLFAARTMQAGMDILEPLIVANNVRPVGRIVLGTVKSDVHDIGKNLVGMMFKGSGFEVIDLGIDIAPETFVEAIKKHKPSLLGMSSLLGSTMQYMKETIQAIEAEGLRSQVKIMVGGAIITEQYAQSIGADGFAPDAASAVVKAKELAGIQ